MSSIKVKKHDISTGNIPINMGNKMTDNKIGISIFLIVATILFGIDLNAKPKDKGVMMFNETVHDFGTVKESGGPVSVSFPFTNTGKANLIIYDAKADCGCTTPEYPKAPIAPGKSGKIKVSFNPLGRPGAFDKIVTIKTNGNPSKVRVKIRGTVMPKK